MAKTAREEQGSIREKAEPGQNLHFLHECFAMQDTKPSIIVFIPSRPGLFELVQLFPLGYDTQLQRIGRVLALRDTHHRATTPSPPLLTRAPAPRPSRACDLLVPGPSSPAPRLDQMAGPWRASTARHDLADKNVIPLLVTIDLSLPFGGTPTSL